MTTPTENFNIRTRYNHIDAVYTDGLLYLQGDEDSLHSIIDLQQPQRLLMENLQMMMISLLFQPKPGNILLLGVAAGSLLHFLRHYLPESHIDAVDIDGELLDSLTGRDLLPPADSRLNYHRRDAFEYLKSCEINYDLVLVDLFTHSQSPAQLLDQQVHRQLHARLNAQGIIACNLLLDSDKDFEQLLESWQSLFDEQVLQLSDDELENRLLLGFKGHFEPATMHDLLFHAQQLSEQHGFDYNATLATLYAMNPVGHGVL